jgi:hypothetical protein
MYKETSSKNLFLSPSHDENHKEVNLGFKAFDRNRPLRNRPLYRPIKSGLGGVIVLCRSRMN